MIYALAGLNTDLDPILYSAIYERNMIISYRIPNYRFSGLVYGQNLEFAYHYYCSAEYTIQLIKRLLES